MNSIILTLALQISATATGKDIPQKLWVGDPVHGQKVYDAQCASCHALDASGGHRAMSLRSSARLAALLDDQLYALIESGRGTKTPKTHAYKLPYLEIWDAIAYLRSQNLGVGDFFGDSTHYLSGDYTIDAHGLERIEQVSKEKLSETSARVFTFFTLPGEKGPLAYVPPEPVRLDQLKKTYKTGYLVFLPFKTTGYTGELGVGMDKNGVITRLLVHEGTHEDKLLNKSLARFVGQGRKGQKTPFQVGGGPAIAALQGDVFKAYLRAMETVTMYDREEHERTWADLD